MITAVIMAGGKGERFWPKSRKKLPKQLLDLTGSGNTMIQLTVERLKSLVSENEVYISTVEDYASLISYQLPKVPNTNILVEPIGRNTAPCIGLAATYVSKNNSDAVMVILPSDHLINNNSKFIQVLEAAIEVAKQGDNLVTIGITPDYPETGYGYINFEEKVDNIKGNDILKVKKFVEKPNRETAEEYLKTGKYLWNSGMFVWKASTILDSFKTYLPEMYDGLMKIKEAIGTEKEEEILNKEYYNFQNISIDYGIMEKAKSIYMIPGDFGWDDVGSWKSLDRINTLDDLGNIIKGNVVAIDTSNCIIEGANKLIATVGLENIVIVDTEDATLICNKDRTQDVKQILSKLKEENRDNYL